VVQRVDIRFTAAAHGHVLDVEALGPPGAQRLDVELIVLGRHVKRRGAVAERQPAVVISKVLEGHGCGGGSQCARVGLFSARLEGMRRQVDGRGAGEAGERAGGMCLGAGGCIMGGLYVEMAGVASQSAILLVQRRGFLVGFKKPHPVLVQKLMTSSSAKPSRAGLADRSSLRCQAPPLRVPSLSSCPARIRSQLLGKH
jgi:hypothetical protein